MTEPYFVKDMPGPSDTRQEGADPEKDTNFFRYQMVPVGGSRKWRVVVPPGGPRVLVYCDRTRSGDVAAPIAGLALSPNGQASQSLDFKMTGDFYIVGLRQEIEVIGLAVYEQMYDYEVPRVVSDNIKVQVQRNRDVICSVVRLLDKDTRQHRQAGREVMPSNEMANILRQYTVPFFESTFNTSLRIVDYGDLEVDRILSDVDEILQLDEYRDNKEDYIFDTILKSSASLSAHIVYVSTWWLAGGYIGNNPGSGKLLNGRTERPRHRYYWKKNRQGPTIIYCSNFSMSNPGNLHWTLTHETGHAFGLEHRNIWWHNSRPAGYLMNVDENYSFKVTRDDIETVCENWPR